MTEHVLPRYHLVLYNNLITFPHMRYGITRYNKDNMVNWSVWLDTPYKFYTYKNLLFHKYPDVSDILPVIIGSIISPYKSSNI